MNKHIIFSLLVLLSRAAFAEDEGKCPSEYSYQEVLTKNIGINTNQKNLETENAFRSIMKSLNKTALTKEERKEVKKNFDLLSERYVEQVKDGMSQEKNPDRKKSDLKKSRKAFVSNYEKMDEANRKKFDDVFSDSKKNSATSDDRAAVKGAVETHYLYVVSKLMPQHGKCIAKISEVPTVAFSPVPKPKSFDNSFIRVAGWKNYQKKYEELQEFVKKAQENNCEVANPSIDANAAWGSSYMNQYMSMYEQYMGVLDCPMPGAPRPGGNWVDSTGPGAGGFARPQPTTAGQLNN